MFLEADNLLSSDVLLSFPLEHVKVILLLQPPAWVRPILIIRPGKTPQQGFVKIHPIAGSGNSRHLSMFLSTYQVRNPKVRSNTTAYNSECSDADVATEQPRAHANSS